MSPASPHEEIVTGEWRGRTAKFHRSHVIVQLTTDRPAGSWMRPDPKVEKEYERRFQEVRSALHGAELVRRIGSWAVLELPPTENVIDSLASLHANKTLRGEIRFAEPDLVVEALAFPPAPLVPRDKGMSSPGVGAPVSWQWGLGVMEMPHTWALQLGNDSVFIVIVDSGILKHDHDLDLDRFWWGGNFRRGDPSGTIVLDVPDGVFTSPPDAPVLAIGFQHGMAVAGVVGAREQLEVPVDPDASGVVGLNWTSPIGICRATNQVGGLQGDVLPAVLQALLCVQSSGQHLVVNLSLAFTSDPQIERGGRTIGTFDFMAEEAEAAGAVLVC
ncbi:MAG: hypothetical protein ACRDGR_10350, partial [bacterium]